MSLIKSQQRSNHNNSERTGVHSTYEYVLCASVAPQIAKLRLRGQYPQPRKQIDTPSLRQASAQPMYIHRAHKLQNNPTDIPQVTGYELQATSKTAEHKKKHIKKGTLRSKAAAYHSHKSNAGGPGACLLALRNRAKITACTTPSARNKFGACREYLQLNVRILYSTHRITAQIQELRI